MDMPEASLETLLARGELSAAVAAASARSASPRIASDSLAAAVYAVAGLERETGGAVDAPMLAARTHAQMTAELLRVRGTVRSDDLLAGAVLLSWCAAGTEVSACLRDAGAKAADEGRAHIAVAALERLSHYALLFGDTMQARAAIEDALSLATRCALGTWRLRCAARAARFALDSDDADRAMALLEESRAAQSPELLALFAPAGVQIALRQGNELALRSWTGPSLGDVALFSDAPDAPIAATCALLLAQPPARTPGADLAAALRRTLVRTANATAAVEFFTLAARYGTEEEALLATSSLRAIFAPQRRYVEAHYRLARAHLLARTGDRAGAVDAAGDAARAFDSMGLRRWTNEAMLLLVRHEERGDAPPRRRPTAVSLTQREQQVAHLIGRGASNREVARALQISEHTVERHVSSILSRLGLRSRWQIVDARNANVEG